MRARTFLVGMVAAVLVMALANVSRADGRQWGWYPRPLARAPYGWYGHPYYHPGYRYYYAPRRAYLPPPGVVYVPPPGAVYAPVPRPAYGGGYPGSGIGISLPGLAFSFSFHGH
jgi:hypothetical protein